MRNLVFLTLQWILCPKLTWLMLYLPLPLLYSYKRAHSFIWEGFQYSGPLVQNLFGLTIALKSVELKMQDHVAKLFYCAPNNFRSISSMLQWPISNEKQTFFYKIKEKVRLGKACSVRPGSDIKITLGSKIQYFE